MYIDNSFLGGVPAAQSPAPQNQKSDMSRSLKGLVNRGSFLLADRDLPALTRDPIAPRRPAIGNGGLR